MYQKIMDGTDRLMDVTSVAVLLGVLGQILTAWASVVTIIWLSIRIYETDTVQNWLKRRRRRNENDKGSGQD